MGLLCLKILILALALFGHPAVAQPTGPFQFETTTPEADEGALMEYKENYRNDSFKIACQNPQDVVYAPETGLTRRFLPTKDKKGVLAKDFLIGLAHHLAAYSAQSANDADNFAYCLLKENQKLPDCAGFVQMSQNELVNHVKLARKHLSLAQSKSDYKKPYGRTDVSYQGNNTMSVAKDSYKEVPWEPATPYERSQADALLQRERVNTWIKHEVTEETYKDLHLNHKGRRTLAKRLKVSQDMQDFRNANFMLYNEMVSEVPLLQHLKSAEPNLPEIQQAAEKLNKLANQETERLIGLIEELEALGPNDPIPPKFLDLMSFNAFTEGLLETNPHFCSIATGLARNKANRQFQNAIGLALPLFAVGLFSPPLIVVGVGVTSSVGFGGYSTYNYIQTRKSRTSQMIAHYEDSEGDMKKDHENFWRGNSMDEIVNARKQMYQEWAIAPLGVVSGGMVRGTVKGGAKALAKTGAGLGSVAQKANRIRRTTTRANWQKLPRFSIRSKSKNKK